MQPATVPTFGTRKKIVGFTEGAVAALRGYPWPGNVRELRNVIERAAILCGADTIDMDHLPSGFSPRSASPELGDPIPLERLEELHIRRVLASSRSLDDAAAVLGIDPATLWRKRKKYGI
jgi:NtrC-family two-component system response regulator AlgB